MNYLIDPTFSKVHRLYNLAFQNDENRLSSSKYYTSTVPTVEINDYNVLINQKPFFEIPIKNKKETYQTITELIRNSDYTTGNLLDYEYFSTHYKLIAIDLSKQTELENPDLKQQINFIGKLKQNATIFFIIEKEDFKLFTKFCRCFLVCIKMEAQKIINLLEESDDDILKFQTRKWYIINDQNNGQYGKGN